VAILFRQALACRLHAARSAASCGVIGFDYHTRVIVRNCHASRLRINRRPPAYFAL
jgi:hypothetical protein